MFEEAREKITNSIYYQKMVKKKAWSPRFFWFAMIVIVAVAVVFFAGGWLLLFLYYYFVPEYDGPVNVEEPKEVFVMPTHGMGTGVGFWGWVAFGGLGGVVLAVPAVLIAVLVIANKK